MMTMQRSSPDADAKQLSVSSLGNAKVLTGKSGLVEGVWKSGLVAPGLGRGH